MSILAAASLVFFVLHRVVSGSPLRDRLVAISGEAIFRRCFALASLLCLAGLWIGFLEARASPANLLLFAPIPGAGIAQIPLQLLACLLITAGVTTRNPTIAGLGAAVHDRQVVRGVLRLTRHPFLWGVAVLSAGHMLARPDIAVWGFFGTLLVLALTGTVSIDAKRRRAFGADWAAFAAATSNIPFAAIVGGRQRLELSEIGWRRPLAGVGAFVLLALVHPYLFGVTVP